MIPASLSLDLDDLWTYLKTQGNPAWEGRPSYLGMLVPRVLDVLEDAGLRLTVFVVGEDAARPANRDLLASIPREGHEVASHSFSHDPWLHLYSRAELHDDLTRAERAIEAAAGVRPAGFRGPGFSWSPLLLEVLAERGYGYDASTLPTFLGPIARRYFLATSKLSAEERERRAGLFGGFREGTRPSGPYRWRLPDGARLLEIPVTTMPGLKLPFHMSYLLWLRRRSRALMHAYLRTALLTCRAARVGPSFLLHPLDFLGAGEAPGLEFFPGMDLSREVKLAAVREVLAVLRDACDPQPMGVAAAAAAAAPLPLRDPGRLPPLAAPPPVLHPADRLTTVRSTDR